MPTLHLKIPSLPGLSLILLRVGSPIIHLRVLATMITTLYALAEGTYRVDDHAIIVDGTEITARALVPTPHGTESRQTYPLLVFMHGGGKNLTRRYL